MISKRKRNTILVYCIASMIMLCAFASNISKVTTNLKTNTKRVVADNNYVETNEISYGLVALEASSSIEEKERAEEAAKKKAEEEAAKKKAEEEAAKKKAAEEAAKKKAAEEAAKKKAAEAKKKQQAASNNKTNSTTSKKEVSSTSDTNLGVRIANYAKQFNGNPYKSGGTSLTNGADCSGFVQTLYKKFGISIPRTARAQARAGKTVSFSELQPGDLVFYSHGGKSINSIAHVAMYIGNGKIIHAQTPRDGIGIDPVNIMTKVTARRYI